MTNRTGMRLISTLLLGAIAIPLHAQTVRSYGTAEHEGGSSIILLPDSGFIITGATRGIGPNNSNILTMRTDQYGDTIWTRVIGAGNENGEDVIYNYQHIYTTNFQAFIGPYGVDVEKMEMNGNVSWGRSYSTAYVTTARFIRYAPGSDMMLFAETVNNGPPYSDIAMIRIDTNGYAQWIKRYGGPSWEYLSDVVQCESGGYAVLASTGSFNNAPNNAYDMMLMRVDYNGDTLWTKRYEVAPYQIGGTSLLQTSDEGFIIAGAANNTGAGQDDILIVRTDSMGDTLWTRMYGGPGVETNAHLAQLNDGGFLVVAQTSTFSPTGNDWQYYFLRLDANGDTLWTNTLGGTQHDVPSDVINTPGNGIAVLGASMSWRMSTANYEFDINLILLDSTLTGPCFDGPTATQETHAQFSVYNCSPWIINGGVTGTDQTPLSSGALTLLSWCNPLYTATIDADTVSALYPNPASDALTIYSGQTDNLRIIDATGNVVGTLTLQSGNNAIDVSMLPDGIYFLQTSASPGRKLLVMHH